MKKLLFLLFIPIMVFGQNTSSSSTWYLLKDGHYFASTDTLQSSKIIGTDTYDSCQLVLIASDSVSFTIVTFGVDVDVAKDSLGTQTLTGTNNNAIPRGTGLDWREFGNVIVGTAFAITSPSLMFKIRVLSASATGNGIVDYTVANPAKYKLYAKLKRKGY